MTDGDAFPGGDAARSADRFYGAFLILLGAASTAAPFFAEATLAWTLLLAGVVGAAWLILDRSPQGFLAAAGWSLVAVGLGLHLGFHLLLDVVPLGLTLGLGFILLGVAEILFGLERYPHSKGARIALVIGGAGAVMFGLAAPTVWPDIPSWAGGATVGLMFATFGVALELGAVRKRAKLRAP